MNQAEQRRVTAITIMTGQTSKKIQEKVNDEFEYVPLRDTVEK